MSETNTTFRSGQSVHGTFRTAGVTAPHPPSLWLRYVDDTYVLIHEYDVEGFTSHINNVDDNIKFTIEPETNSKLPFLDLCTHVLDDGSTKLTIYRKPTHTDQYLNFKSHHPLEHKRSVVHTLTTRAMEYVTTQADKKAELVHVRAALKANDYPEWALEVPRPSKPRAKNTAGPSGSNTRRPMLGVPYVAGLRTTGTCLQSTQHPYVSQTSQHTALQGCTPQGQDSLGEQMWNCISHHM